MARYNKCTEDEHRTAPESTLVSTTRLQAWMLAVANIPDDEGTKRVRGEQDVTAARSHDMPVQAGQGEKKRRRWDLGPDGRPEQSEMNAKTKTKTKNEGGGERKRSRWDLGPEDRERAEKRIKVEMEEGEGESDYDSSEWSFPESDGEW